MVEWKKIGDICEDVIVPMRDRPKIFDGTIPWCRIEDIEGMFFNKSLSGLMVSEEVIKKMNLKVYPTGTVICSCSATLGVCAINTQPLITNQTFIGLVCSDQIINRFLFYYMLTRKRELLSLSTTGTIPYVSREKFEKMMVPVPSLSEQNRIVGILDTFTSSIENLKQQIAERRKQYEHYRDQLLDLEGKEGVVRFVLKDICEVINGRAYSQPELLSEGKYRVLRVGNFFSNDSWYYSDLELDNKYYCENGDLLYAWSASFGPHIWEEEKVIYHYHIWKMNCGEWVNKKFMYYWLQSEDMRSQAFTNLHGATMAHLTKALMESLMVPIPSLEDQSRIVSILDTFEASIANLEAQLSQREKQYEYYRNKLLTFD